MIYSSYFYSNKTFPYSEEHCHSIRIVDTPLSAADVFCFVVFVFVLFCFQITTSAERRECALMEFASRGHWITANVVVDEATPP